jgi:hypothetical protein
MHTHLSGNQYNPGGTITRNFWQPQSPTGALFTYPGLGHIGNAGGNTYTGPSYFGDDMTLLKTIPIWESVSAQFRFDAFNAFNHITAGNPNNGDIFGNGPISGEAAAAVPRQLDFAFRIQF